MTEKSELDRKIRSLVNIGFTDTKMIQESLQEKYGFIEKDIIFSIIGEVEQRKTTRSNRQGTRTSHLRGRGRNK